MRFFFFTEKDWQHAEEFLTEAEAREAYEAALADGCENCSHAAVYSAPRREIFNAYMSKQCRVVCAGIPHDHPFIGAASGVSGDQQT